MLPISRFIVKNTSNLITRPRNRLYQFTTKNYSMKDVDEDPGPIKYSKSPASRWRAEVSRTGYISDRLWYEPIVILASLSVFMLYFCVFRQENDIDLELQKSLYSRIKGLEEHQLNATLQYNEQHGLDSHDVIQRLNEIKKGE